MADGTCPDIYECRLGRDKMLKAFVRAHVLYENDRMKQALNRILKWQFAVDGRKFDGNHKLILKEIMGYVEAGLGIQFKPMKKRKRKK